MHALSSAEGGGDPPALQPAAPLEADWAPLTTLAKRVLRTPIALLVMPDANGLPQVSAVVGCDVKAIDLPALDAAIRPAKAPVTVRDAGSGTVRAYAAVGLPTPAEGWLAVADVQPREFSATDIETLVDLAAFAQRQLAIHSAAASARIERDALAQRVQDRTGELAMLNGTLRQHIVEREIAEAAVRRSESKFRALIENAQDLISVLTPDGISLYQSPSIQHLLGYNGDDLVGRNLFDEFLHPDDRDTMLSAAARIVDSGEHYVRTEVRYRHADGQWRLLESVSSSTPPDSPVIGIVVNSRDITDRRKTEMAHEARTREQTAVAELGRFALGNVSLPEILEEAATLVARALRVPFSAISELSVEPGKLHVRAGTGWAEDVADALVDDWRAAADASEPGAVERPLIIGNLDDRMRHGLVPKKGTPAPRSAVSVVIQCAGQRFGSVCALSPATDHFPAQDAVFLQTIADMLSAIIENLRHEEELKQAQVDTQAAKEEAVKANHAKSEFLSRVSHELRTPLNAILGFGQLLDLEPLSTSQRSSVDQILKGGSHLLDLINEVLDITRLETGGMELTLDAVDVAEVISETLDLVRPLAMQTQIQLGKIPALPTAGLAVMADRGRLVQVLFNVLANAVKYNRPGGSVLVTCTHPNPETVRLAITDTGPGLTPQELSELFTPFQRLSAPQRGIAGTGIGLTISRSLIESMGGAIGVTSTPGVGSTFYLDLTVAHREAVAPAVIPSEVRRTGEPAGHLPQSHHVLLVDDQPANVALVERVFDTRTDLRLSTAMDGRSGLTKARQEPPDLILLDLHLPDIPGDEVMRRLHIDPSTRDVPVVVLSADATPAQVARLRELGVHEYVIKPFRIRDLLGAVDSALAARKGAAAPV